MAALHNGYPQGVDYLKLVFNILSPVRINFCLDLVGRASVDLAQGFTYAELGAGFGLSVAGWAAQFPQAQFHSVDYNTQQARWTTQLAESAGLDNLHVHGCSVAEALAKDLPQFDFVVLHGLYSWVSAEVRADVRLFLSKFLKPGGCVYIGYNTMPGFKDVEPMRALVSESLRAAGDTEPYAVLQQSLHLLQRLKESGSAFFSNSPQAAIRLNAWFEANPAYLTAELLTGAHRAYYFREICDELAEEGIHWATSADVIHYLEAHNSPQALQELLAPWEGNEIMRETIKDNFYNTAFRYDLFVKKPEPAHRARGGERLAKTAFCLAHTHTPLPKQASLNNFHAILDPALYTPLQAVLSKFPTSLEQLERALRLPSAALLRALTVFVALDWAHPALPEAVAGVGERVKRFNVALHKLMGKNSLVALLSARGGWVKDREQIDYLYVVACLEGADIEEYILTALLPDNTLKGAGGVAGKAEEEAELRLMVKKYIVHNSRDMGAFLKRHGLV